MGRAGTKKIRKRLTDQYGVTKLRTVCECSCKIGTTAKSVAYFFFDKPELNQSVWCVQSDVSSVVCKDPIRVVPDQFHDDGFFFCYKL